MSSKNRDNASQPPVSKSAKKYSETGTEPARILIAPRRGANAIKSNIQPLSAIGFKSKLGQIQNLEIIKTIKPSSAKLSPLALSGDEASEIQVCNIDANMLDLVKRSAPPELIIETDHHLQLGDAISAAPKLDNPLQLLAANSAQAQTVQIQVVGDNGKPLPNISVVLTGDAFPSKGTTNANGEISLELFVLPGNSAKSLFMVPFGNYWDRYISNPKLSTSAVNTVQLKSLVNTIPNFPQQYPYCWGGRKMGLDKLSRTVTGAGVKVAIIDSGCATDHPLLKHITHGKDLTDGGTAKSWTTDSVGHGSHVSGTIAASGEMGMLRGFVPDAEIHELKVFPGGRFSSLLEALDYCIENDIDIVNMSLGSPNMSEVVEQKLEETYANGIFLVAAAGNSGGSVQFPAMSSYTMAVAAIGLENEYPQDSWDAQTVQSQYLTPDGIFSPTFSCFGPQINVTGPGVAIISTFPGQSYEALSGTSMAAPHITGAAAVLLAHHPIFKSSLGTRSPERIQTLYQLMATISAPHPFGAERVGHGMPRVDLVQELQAAEVENQQAQAATTAARGIIFQPVTEGYPRHYPTSNPLSAYQVPQMAWVQQPNGFRRN